MVQMYELGKHGLEERHDRVQNKFKRFNYTSWCTVLRTYSEER